MTSCNQNAYYSYILIISFTHKIILIRLQFTKCEYWDFKLVVKFHQYLAVVSLNVLWINLEATIPISSAVTSNQHPSTSFWKCSQDCSYEIYQWRQEDISPTSYKEKENKETIDHFPYQLPRSTSLSTTWVSTQLIRVYLISKFIYWNRFSFFSCWKHDVLHIKKSM